MPYKTPHIHEIFLGLSQAYLIQAGSGWVLVDAGMPGQQGSIMRHLRSLRHGELKLIYLTHAHIDHFGSAAALRRITGAPIAIHPQDAQALALGETRLGSTRGIGKYIQALLPKLERLFKQRGVEADLLVEDGDDLDAFGLNGTIYHTPGHTAGSSSLIVEGQLAFVGDLASNTGKPHLQRYYAYDWAQIEKSYQRLTKLDLNQIYTGHGRGYIQGETFKMLGRPSS